MKRYEKTLLKIDKLFFPPKKIIKFDEIPVQNLWDRIRSGGIKSGKSYVDKSP